MKNPYSFSENIGRPIYIATKGMIDVESKRSTHIEATLLGSEPGGLWIKPLEGHFLQNVLWQHELEQGGLEAVGQIEIGYFIPFSEIRFTHILLPRE